MLVDFVVWNGDARFGLRYCSTKAPLCALSRAIKSATITFSTRGIFVRVSSYRMSVGDKGRLNVAECLVRTLCRFTVQTMVTETDEKVQEEVGFFFGYFF